MGPAIPGPFLNKLTDGEIFLATDDAGTALRLAFSAMRRRHEAQPAITGVPMRAEARLGGMLVGADWALAEAGGKSAIADDRFGRAAADFAAAIAIPRMAEQEATTLAEAEGIVCHRPAWCWWTTKAKPKRASRPSARLPPWHRGYLARRVQGSQSMDLCRIQC